MIIQQTPSSPLHAWHYTGYGRHSQSDWPLPLDADSLLGNGRRLYRVRTALPICQPSIQCPSWDRENMLGHSGESSWKIQVRPEKNEVFCYVTLTSWWATALGQHGPEWRVAGRPRPVVLLPVQSHFPPCKGRGPASALAANEGLGCS